MGLINAKIILRNPKDSDIKALEVNALVDSGAVHLCIPEHIKIQLKLDEIDKKEATLVDGRKQLVPLLDPLKLCLRIGWASPVH